MPTIGRYFDPRIGRFLKEDPWGFIACNESVRIRVEQSRKSARFFRRFLRRFRNGRIQPRWRFVIIQDLFN